MRNVRIGIDSQIVLYVTFVLMNFLELIWNCSRLFDHRPPGPLDYLMEQELGFHKWLNLISYFTFIFFLLVCNHFVRKHGLGKGYHFLVVLLGFFPVAYYFLFFIIWRKLNKVLFIYSGENPLKSDRKIIVVWVFVLLSFVGTVIQFSSPYFLSNPGILSTIGYLIPYIPIIHSVYLLGFSVVCLTYFFEFRRIVLGGRNDSEYLSEDVLLDK